MTDLFDLNTPQLRNLLPRDGLVHYHGAVFSPAQADAHFQTLLDSIPWRQDETVMFGKRIVTQRKVAWFADRAYSYTYSQVRKTALPWHDSLLPIKAHAELTCGEQFNSCLLNLYHTGSEGMGWHSDAEKELEPNAAIASVSFGAERDFRFKHKTSKETVSVALEHGALLIMKGQTQTHWLHALPKTARVQSPRINLTFRRISEAVVVN